MKKSYVLSSLSDAFLIFIGITGAIFSSVTSYELQVDQFFLIIIIALTSIAASFALHLENIKHRIAAISYIVLSLLAILPNKDLLVGGFLRFANKMLFLFKKFNDNIELFSTYNYVAFTDEAVFTTFFAVVACIGAILAAFALIKLRSVTVCLLFTLPIIAPALIFVNLPPDISLIILYMGFILGAVLTNSIRTGKKNTASGFILALPALFMLFFISIVSPVSQYQRSNVGQDIYNYLTERLPLTTGNSTKNDTISPDVVKNYIDLNNSFAPKSYSIVMKIKSEMRGTFLLRGASYDLFNGVSWKISNDDQPSYVSQTIDASWSSKNLIINPFDSPTFAFNALEIPHKTVEINHITAGSSLVYMPYLAFIDEDDPFIFNNDSYFTINPGDNIRAYYSFDALNYFNISPSEMLDSYSSNAVGESQNFTSLYNSNNWIYDTYLQIDTETRNFMLRTSLEAGIESSTDDPTQLINDIADYIRNCAEYDINTPATPPDENFVIYFMRESKRGFCMHFASAATMMYRAWGIPARYVTGYSTYISGEDVGKWTVIRQKNAHAWVEVYIDDLGWVPVDATPAISGVTAPTEIQDESSEANESEPAVSEPETEVSESETSSTLSTASEQNVSQDTSSSIELNDFWKWILIAVSALIIISIPFLRRQYKRRKRKKAFEGPTNKAAIAAWQYIERLMKYGAEPNPKVYDIALKAVFSNHTLTEDEANKVVNSAYAEANKIYKSMGFFRKLVFCYVKALY